MTFQRRLFRMRKYVYVILTIFAEGIYEVQEIIDRLFMRNDKQMTQRVFENFKDSISATMGSTQLIFKLDHTQTYSRLTNKLKQVTISQKLQPKITPKGKYTSISNQFCYIYLLDVTASYGTPLDFVAFLKNLHTQLTIIHV